MLKIDIINYKKKKATKAYLFVSFIVFKSTIADNINIFEDLNIK